MIDAFGHTIRSQGKPMTNEELIPTARIDAENIRDFQDELTGLLTERGKTHGDFSNHAGCTQELKDCVHKWLARSGKSWAEMPYEVRESLDMILHKVGRIVAGNELFPDHWDDIAGYAKLVPQRVNKP